MISSPAEPKGRTDLNGPPPTPSSSVSPRSLIDAEQDRGGGAAIPPSPYTMVIEGMARFEQAVRLISSGLPALAPAMQELLANLQQVVPKALSDTQAGIGATPGSAPPTPPVAGPPAPTM